MEIESAECECCGLKEDCTRDYIAQVKDKFHGKWLCGLCSEAVADELLLLLRSNITLTTATTTTTAPPPPLAIGEAVKAHMSFCRKIYKSNPATQVADGMRQMLRRRRSSTTSAAATSSLP